MADSQVTAATDSQVTAATDSQVTAATDSQVTAATDSQVTAATDSQVTAATDSQVTSECVIVFSFFLPLSLFHFIFIHSRGSRCNNTTRIILHDKCLLPKIK